MPIWILLTQDERDAATALDGGGVALGARQIDNPAAGELVGLWAAPARLLSDPDYARWVAALGTLPTHDMDSEALFLPIAALE